ncbi:MAG: cell division topological specificity factor MinE [Exilibacterium sp.]
MRIFDYFHTKEKQSATIAKERLQIIVAHERNRRNPPDFLPRLQQEILGVIRNYISIDEDDVEILIDQQGSCSVLEVNIVLPDAY